MYLYPTFEPVVECPHTELNVEEFGDIPLCDSHHEYGAAQGLSPSHTTTIKADLEPLFGPRVFGHAR